MAHLRIEYSAGVEDRADVAAFCRTMRSAMEACGIFPVAGIRVRAFMADHAVIADGHDHNDFLAMTLSVGAGRPKEVLAQAGSDLFGAAQVFLAEPLSTRHFALSLEIRVIDPDLSWKDTPIHARISGQS